jgi:hypothetical protein
VKCQIAKIRGFDSDEPPEPCDSEATHTNCLLVGAVVCAAHRCRCSKLLPSDGTTWLKEFEAKIKAAGLPWYEPWVTRDPDDGLNLEWFGDKFKYPRRMGAIVDGSDTGCWLVSRYEPGMDGPHDLSQAFDVYKRYVRGPSWRAVAVYQWRRSTSWLTSR